MMDPTPHYAAEYFPPLLSQSGKYADGMADDDDALQCSAVQVPKAHEGERAISEEFIRGRYSTDRQASARPTCSTERRKKDCSCFCSRSGSWPWMTSERSFSHFGE